MTWDDARGRRHAAGVHPLDLFGVRQNLAELAGVEIELRVVQIEARECGDGFDVLSGEPGGHDRC